MSKIITYYTRDGNSRQAANILSDKFECDIIELKEIKMRKKNIWGFLKCGMDTKLGRKSLLINDVKKEFAGFDEIYIVTPIWAGSYVPAINTLLSDIDMKDKTIYMYACQADKKLSALKNVKARFKKVLEEKDAIYGKCYCVQGAGPNKKALSYEHFSQSIKALE